MQRAAGLILRLRARRLWNVWGLRLQRKRPRGGTAAKRRVGWLFPALVTAAMILGTTSICFSILHSLDAELGPGAPFARGEALAVLLTWMYGLLLTLANSELAKPDWDLEFLVTLPVRLPTMLAIRLLERTVICPGGYLTTLPFLFAHYWWYGDRWSAAPRALLAVLPLNAILAAAQTVLDTGLKLRLGPARLRNLQAIGHLAGIFFLYLVLSQGQGHTLVADLSRHLPHGFRVTPFALAVTRAPLATALLAVQAAIALGLALVALRALLSQGVVAQGERETGRRAVVTRAPSARIGPLALRELRILRRDRSFLVQTLLLPVIIVGFQAFNGRGFGLLTLTAHPGPLGGLAFAVAAYALMFSAFQTLSAEGEAIWILYTFPFPLRTILRDKAFFWARWAMVYPFAFFAAYFLAGGPPSWEAIGAVVLTTLGVVIYAPIATALGIFACDPLAKKVERRIRPSFVYLYLMLVSLYTYAMIAATVWEMLALVTLSVSLALALWQKAADSLPFLLDPAAQPPATVSVSDGMCATMFFFVAQSVALLFWPRHGGLYASVTFAYAAAGLATYALARLLFWKYGTSGVPRVFRRRWPRDLALGFAGGAITALLAGLYLHEVHRFGWFQKYWKTPELSPKDWRLLAILAVVGAPLAEEFLFRGLIFGGLRRTWRWPVAALASAALFAIVHPPPSAAPVLILGLVAAALYQLTDRLLAGMVAHATYNAVVLWLS